MRTKRTVVALACATLLVFGLALFAESVAWARAGGGSSSGSRGGRSFSTPSMPSRPAPSSPSPSSPGYGAPGRSFPGSQPSTGGWFSRSPFLQGMAGGLAGGLLGSMLFGGRSYATPGMAPGMGGGGGGLPILDLLILGLIGYFVYRYFKRRKAAQMAAGSQYYAEQSYGYPDDRYAAQQGGYYDRQPEYVPAYDAVEDGFRQIRVYDPGFNEEVFKESVQDLFFRIQAGWMNRSLQGIEGLLAPEMGAFFRTEFDKMKAQGVVNRLENIAIRKVEPSEVWQETGKDYITVLFTANLLDYTVSDKTGEVVGGDKLNPVKFQEFWTFVRDIGTSQWRLTAINQMADVPMRN